MAPISVSTAIFFGTELASKGLPEGRELEILNEIKDKVPAEVFATPYANPVGGNPQAQRDNLRKAVGLLKKAGYEIRARPDGQRQDRGAPEFRDPAEQSDA